MNNILYALSSVAGIAILFLFFHAIFGGGVLSDEVEDFLVRMALSVLILTGIGFLYHWKRSPALLGLTPLALIPVLWLFFGKKIKRGYAKRFSRPSSPDLWVCRKCGEENHAIRTECVGCGVAKGE
jgi:hypothetical protein